MRLVLIRDLRTKKDKVRLEMQDKNKRTKKPILAIVYVAMLTLSLSSCGSYSSSFVCPDAKGANCRSMGDVYTMIKSGEIEIYNEQNSRCRGRKCSKKSKTNPHLKKKLKKIEIFYKQDT